MVRKIPNSRKAVILIVVVYYGKRGQIIRDEKSHPISARHFSDPIVAGTGQSNQSKARISVH